MKEIVINSRNQVSKETLRTLFDGEEVSFVHPYHPEGWFQGDFKVAPVDCSFMKYLPETLLPGREYEHEHPELTMAASAMARHPIVEEIGFQFMSHDIINCPQGIFEARDKEDNKWVYALRLGKTSAGEGMALTALTDGSSYRFGFFRVEKYEERKFKIKGKEQRSTTNLPFGENEEEKLPDWG